MDDAARIEELQARLEALEAKLAGATDVRPAARLVSRPEPVATDTDREPTRFDRRGFLRRAAVVGGAAAGGGALALAGAAPAEAATGGTMVIGQANLPTAAGDPPTQLVDPSSTVLSPVLFRVNNYTTPSLPLPATSRIAVAGTVSGTDTQSAARYGVYGATDVDGTGVQGVSATGIGVAGVCGGATVSPTGVAVGVQGQSGAADGFGVFGYAPTGAAAAGVYGSAAQGVGVQAESSGTAPAMAATAYGSGDGLVANSGSAHGVVGLSGGASEPVVDGAVGVYGVAHGDGTIGVAGRVAVGNGIGVLGEGYGGIGVSAESSGGSPAVLATSLGPSSAIQAQSGASTAAAVDAASSGRGPGLTAASSLGVGATFKGKAAAIQLVPQTKAGAPTAGQHKAGELIVDSAGQPWLCTASGTPGTWKKLLLG